MGAAVGIGLYAYFCHHHIGAVVKIMDDISKMEANNEKQRLRQAQMKAKAETYGRVQGEFLSQAVQNTILALSFGLWPFLQRKAQYNLAIAYPLVLGIVIVGGALVLFNPLPGGGRSSSASVDSSQETSVGATVGSAGGSSGVPPAASSEEEEA